jgi:hypothetical protein
MEEEHLSPLKATKKAMHEIAGAIIAITFLMVFYSSCLSGPVGVFYRQLYDGNCNHSFRDRGIDIDTCTLCYNVKTIMVKLKRKLL